LRLTLFDLDHTLLDGDSDQLWCEFLMDRGVLPREPFEALNRAMARDYQLGQVSAQDFCDFYIGTLKGRSAAEWQPLRRDWLDSCIVPLIPAAALALVARHRDGGDLVVLSTATCRFLSELTAVHLGISQLIATECETDAAGRFSGRSQGVLNMREGKVQRLHDWLAAQKVELADCESTLYSDSINDLPLLSAVRTAVAVDPDAQLAQQASDRGWAVISMR
jgi:HAD superfamily hydrolase (TIGR01490 family)